MNIQEHLNNYQVDYKGCWIYQGPVNDSGYAYASLDGVAIGLHVLAFERKGTIDLTLERHHLCFTRNCINPNHIIQITRRRHKYLHSKTCV